MSTTPHHRPQTLKQAKAAYKARSRPYVSEREQRQLERGAELLRRAERIKEAERRKKENLKRKAEKEIKEREAKKRMWLGSEGYMWSQVPKPSQAILDRFVRIKGRGEGRETEIGVDGGRTAKYEPWDVDEVDDETLLDVLDDNVEDIMAHEPQPISSPRPLKTEDETTYRPANRRPAVQGSNDLHLWEDFLASSTQIARELKEDDKQVVSVQLPAASLVFGSQDFKLSVEDIQELGMGEKPKWKTAKEILQCDTTRASPAHTMMPPSRPPITKKIDADRKMMPPPAMKPVKKQASGATHTSVLSIQDLGISSQDILYIADNDVVFTQQDPS
ncbi:hypothetical protein B0A49_04269 [Cryomyces minteri]|uniref:Uncharacterized protein n=1 Tax=Cryomyces minteri TaxID=331657 RepID=A0A4U0XGS8_9PEZI|nr:hypothetical protein B0A49_04269 [Cryomyces minteri]